MKNSQAYRLGYDAYLGPWAGKTNPYPVDSTEHAYWEAGFNAAAADCSW